MTLFLTCVLPQDRVYGDTLSKFLGIWSDSCKEPADVRSLQGVTFLKLHDFIKDNIFEQN